MEKKPNKNERIPTDIEVRIVAYMGRGDSYPTIQAKIAEETGRVVTEKTFTAIKKRNAENLAILKKKVTEFEEADALSLKDQANKILKTKLDKTSKEEEIKAKLHEDYLAGNIEASEYFDALKLIGTTTIPELVVVSKEMHQQSKAEPDKPQATERNLEALSEAIKNGDELVLNQLIFNPKKDKNA
jgi:hypothetical protein